MKLNRNLIIVTIISAIIGLVDSIYLTWVKLSNTAAYCLPGVGDCETVNNSRYAAINGIPIALLGALAYLTILVVLLSERGIAFFASYGPLAIFGISLIGVIYSAYLTYLELAILHAVCPFCVLSAITMTIIFIGTTIRLMLHGSQNS